MNNQTDTNVEDINLDFRKAWMTLDSGLFAKSLFETLFTTYKVFLVI